MAAERGVIRPIRRFLHGHPGRRVAELAAEAWGVLSMDELLECGLSPDGVLWRRRIGQLHRLHRGVYAVGHPNPPWQGLLLAAVKALGPNAVLSHFSAAALWGFMDYAEDRCPDVTVIGNGGQRHPGIRVHRTGELAPTDRLRTHGVPVTAAARTLLDLAAVMDERPLRAAVRRAQGLRLVGVGQLAEVLTRLGPRRGSRKLAAIVATGPAPTRSVLEDVVLDLLLDAGFVHPDVNKPLVIGGRRLIPDFRWPEQRLVVEADGAAWHSEKVAREADAERQAFLEQAGERVLRVTWTQALSHRAQTIARIANAGAPRS